MFLVRESLTHPPKTSEISTLTQSYTDSNPHTLMCVWRTLRMTHTELMISNPFGHLHVKGNQLQSTMQMMSFSVLLNEDFSIVRTIRVSANEL